MAVISIYILCYLFTSLISVVIANESDTGNNSIIQLSGDQSYQANVLDSKDAWVVVYSSKNVEDGLETLSIKLANFGIRCGSVDCDDKSNKKLCQRNEASLLVYTDVPTLNPYTKKNFRIPIPYLERKIDLKALERFISKSFSNSIIKVSSYKDFDNIRINSSYNTLVTLFTDKDAISMHYKSIAFPFRTRKDVVFLQAKSDPDAELNLSHNITITPALTLFLKQKEENKISHFDNDIKNRIDTIDWISSQLPPEIVDIPKESTSSKAEEIPILPRNILQISTKEFHKEIISEYQYAWIVGVKLANTSSTVAIREEERNFALALTKIAKNCDGALRCAVVDCSIITPPNNDLEDPSESTVELQLEDGICSGSWPGSSNKDQVHYLLVIPHGQVSRKKLTLTTLSKYVYNLEDMGSAVKKAGESLPENVVMPLSEELMQNFLSVGHSRKILTVIALSTKDRDSGPIPVMLRHLGLIFGIPYGGAEPIDLEVAEKYGLGQLGLGIAQIGLMPNPSKQFLDSFGGGDLKLPTLIVMHSNPSADEDQAPQMQVAVYDARYFGPLNLMSAKGFISEIFSRSGLEYPEYLLAKEKMGTKSTTRKTEPEVPPVVEEEDVVFEDSTPDPDAEAFLEEIKREEQEKAAKLQKELEEEKEKALEAERLRLAEEKAKKNKKTKKSKKKKSTTKTSEL